jgi:hypothetical protein
MAALLEGALRRTDAALDEPIARSSSMTPASQVAREGLERMLATTACDCGRQRC